jgi:hypothetical protein
MQKHDLFKTSCLSNDMTLRLPNTLFPRPMYSHTHSHTHAQTSEDAVDVFADGFAFRLSLYSGRDEALLAQLTSSMLSRPSLSSKPALASGPTASDASLGGPSATADDPASLAASPESLPLIRNWHHGLIQVRAFWANPSQYVHADLERKTI